MDEQKKKIVKAAEQYASYLAGKEPQVDENGRMKYYFSGSIAMLLLSAATSFKTSSVDIQGATIEEGREFEIPDKNRTALAQGVRQLSMDVDIVSTCDVFLKGEHSLVNVRNNCDLVGDLCPVWMKPGGGTMYLDNLTDDREFVTHDVAELTMQNGSKILIASPLSLIVHKLADTMTCLRIIKVRLSKENGNELAPRVIQIKKKYEKDIEDFVSVFNGIVSLYPELDFKKLIEHILEAIPSSAISNITDMDWIENLKKFHADCKDKISDDCKDKFDKFVDDLIDINTYYMEQTAEHNQDKSTKK